MCDMASLNSFLLPIHRVPKLVETYKDGEYSFKCGHSH